jgi:hypothetical protein
MTTMKLLIGLLLLSFLAIDWLTFHDVLKPAEDFTPVQYLMGVVSIPTMALLLRDLLKAS